MEDSVPNCEIQYKNNVSIELKFGDQCLQKTLLFTVSIIMAACAIKVTI